MRTLPIRRKLSELIQLYKLERQLCDLFVEGPADRTILNEFFRTVKLDRQVYHCDQIEFPETVTNKRSTLIHLALLLKQIGGMRPFCVIDLDEAAYTKTETPHENLILTDYTSLEIYPMTFEAIQRHLRLAYHFELSQADYDFSCHVSKVIFAFRILRSLNKWHDTLPDIGKNLVLQNEQLIFDFDSFVVRLESRNSCAGKWCALRGDIERIITEFVGDYRFYINVHDQSEVLKYVVRLRSNGGIDLADFTLEKILRLNFRDADFELPLFGRIRQRAA
jgi:hypothetical protein